MILSLLASWSPFKIDALGLVTILGATELDLSLGSLVRNRLTEFLPLLAPFLVAGNNIVSSIPGFAVYNITDGILATDVAGWFARWLLCQKLTWNSTEMRVEIDFKRVYRLENSASELVLGVLGISSIVALPILTGDWFGLVNAVSIVLSVLVRLVVVTQNRIAVDCAALAGFEFSEEFIKTFWTIPNGRAVTIYIPRGVLISCLLTTPHPPNPRIYTAARVIGWAAFGCHIIMLGMTTLVNQILTVVVLVTATILASRQIGADQFHLASRLNINRFDHPDPHDSRTSAYVRLNLSATEERKCVAWSLLPHESNQQWWRKYRTLLGKEQECYRIQRAETV